MWWPNPNGSFHKWGYPKMDGFPWKIPFKWMIWRWPHFSKPPNEQYKGMCIILLESLYFMGHKCLMFWQDLQLSWSLARHWFASQWCSQSEDFEGRHLVQTPGGRMIRASLNHFCQLIGIPSHCGKKQYTDTFKFHCIDPYNQKA